MAEPRVALTPRISKKAYEHLLKRAARARKPPTTMAGELLELSLLDSDEAHALAMSSATHVRAIPLEDVLRLLASLLYAQLRLQAGDKSVNDARLRQLAFERATKFLGSDGDATT